MATPLLSNVPTTITLCESITGWSGDTFNLEPDIKVQGGNSVSCAMTNNGVNNIQYATSNSPGGQFSAVNQHIRVWINLAFVGNINTEANDGIQIQVVSGSGTALYTVAGSDTYAGGWSQFVIYTGNTPTTGSVPTGTCTAVGITVNTNSKPRNQPANCWVDAWYFGDGYTVTGGTSGDVINWDGIAALDIVEAYGIVTKQDDVYFTAGSISIGSGATATYFESGEKIQFKDLPVASNLYRITAQGTGCDYIITGGSIGAAGGQDYAYDCSDTDVTVDIFGVQFAKSSAVNFAAGQSIEQCVFDGCGQINPTTSTFRSNTISNYVGTLGSVLFPSNDSNFGNLTIINCDNGIEYGSGSDSSTPILDNIEFIDMVGQYDVNNTSGAAITLNIQNGGNGSTFNPAGDTVTFENPKTFKFTLNPSMTGYEWRIYTVTAAGSLNGSVEIAGEESATQDNQTYAYNYTGDTIIAVQILPQPTNDYEEKVIYEVLTDSNKNIGILLEPDNNN